MNHNKLVELIRDRATNRTYLMRYIIENPAEAIITIRELIEALDMAEDAVEAIALAKEE